MTVKASVEFALKSEFPPRSLAKELEYPDKPSTNYNERTVPDYYKDITSNIVDASAKEVFNNHIKTLRGLATAGTITIGDAVNLAILEEMERDPTTTIHAEDLQAGSSYNIPKLTQQTFGKLRAADEIIDEGHFIGKALGEGNIKLTYSSSILCSRISVWYCFNLTCDAATVTCNKLNYYLVDVFSFL